MAKHLPPEGVVSSDGVEATRVLSAATADHLKSLRAVEPLVSRFSFATTRTNSIAKKG
jgi:hypothetical protein